MLAFVAAPSASAQVSRIALETRHCQHENYVNVYEYDFVDVQPQFPGDDRGLMNYINHERKYPLTHTAVIYKGVWFAVLS